MKRIIATLALLGAAVAAHAAGPVVKPVVTENNASCEIGTYPAATLLLPYFEVDFQASQTQAVNTLFTVVNTSRNPQVARVTVWTDWGFPAMWFSVFLTGYDAQTLSMYEIVAKGNIPYTSTIYKVGPMSLDNRSNANFNDEIWCERAGGTLTPELRAKLQGILSKGIRSDADCRIGGEHRNATGYVTVDVVNSCAIDSPLDASYWNEVILFDNVLTGDYERINPDAETGNYAGGNPLVHIRAVPEGGPANQPPVATALPYTFYDRYTPPNLKKIDRRQPLPSAFAARWIQGGREGFETNFAIWREGLTGTVASECAYSQNAKIAVNVPSIVRFDEHDNPVSGAPSATATLPAASAVPSSSAIFPPAPGSQDVAGWMWLSLDNHARNRPSQNWVVVQMYAEGRYAVDFDATALANGCTAPPAAPQLQANTPPAKQ